MKISNYIKFSNGKKRPKENGTIPVYGGNGILGYTNKSNTNKNNIIIGRVGAYCGCVYKCDNECWISDNAILGKVKEGTDYNFLYYLLKSIDLHRLHIGAAHPLMTQEILNDVDINLPSYFNQVKIGRFLEIIDKKIELNCKINDNLLNINKNLYKEWFIDYKFPGYNRNLKKTSMGLIPEDWDIKKISELDLDISDGNYSSKYPTKSEFIESGIPFIRGTDFNGCSISRKGLMYISELKHEELKKGHLKKNDILITTRGEIGRIAYVFDYFIDANINAQLIRINGGKKYPRAFLGTALLSDNVQRDIQSLVTGTALQQLPVGKFNEIKLVIPNDNNIIQQFNNIIEDNLKSMDLLWQENEYLEQLRDTLLPQLMNGKIDLDKIEI